MYRIQSFSFSHLSLPELKDLFVSVGWDWSHNDVDMTTAFSGSFGLYGCLVDGKWVAFGRLVSDGSIYGLLVDCMVDPKYRRRGIGQDLVRYILEDAKERNLKVIQLLSSVEGLHVYRKLGFETCLESSPGMVRFL